MILAIWVSQVWQPVVVDWMPRVDGLIRYALAIPGALTAAIAMRRQARKAYSQKLGGLAAGWRMAAYSFAGYAFTQSVVPPSDLWPASIWNTSVFIDSFGFPVQGLRAALAVVLTLSLIHAIQAMEAERQKEFLADASAIQFTRNPPGIVGALKKIGGYMKGSKIDSASALQASHMFFGESHAAVLFTRFLATHPPLVERINRLLRRTVSSHRRTVGRRCNWTKSSAVSGVWISTRR